MDVANGRLDLMKQDYDFYHSREQYRATLAQKYTLKSQLDKIQIHKETQQNEIRQKYEGNIASLKQQKDELSQDSAELINIRKKRDEQKALYTQKRAKKRMLCKRLEDYEKRKKSLDKYNQLLSLKQQREALIHEFQELESEKQIADSESEQLAKLKRAIKRKEKQGATPPAPSAAPIPSTRVVLEKKKTPVGKKYSRFHL